MYRLKQILFAVSFLFAFMLEVNAQNMDSVKKDIDTIAAKLHLSDSLTFSTDLFLHLDKNVYATSENIWFAAYLLNNQENDEPYMMHVVLIDDMTQKVVSSGNYVLENGIGSGSFLIPGSLQTGEYSLIAYTNRYPLGRDSRFFHESIRIFGADDLPFNLTFSALTSGDSLLIAGKILGKNKDLTTTTTMSYCVYADGKLAKKSMQLTNALGELNIAISIPTNLNSVEILGEVKNDKDRMSFRVPVKRANRLSQILFFPEDGKLINARPSNIYFELKGNSGKAISTNLSLFEDSEPITSFSSDIYGRGKFGLTPKSGKVYIVKVDNDSISPRQQFPPILTNPSWSLHAQSIVMDSLQLQIEAPVPGSESLIMIYNNREIFYGAYLRMPNSFGSLSIPVTEWPKGLTMISLFDNEQVLQSQKVVLLKKSNSIVATIQADSANYHPFSKVTMHIKLVNADGTPVRGIFSFAAVLAKALNKSSLDIERFNTYDRFLPQLSAVPPLTYLTQNKNIENSLSVFLSMPQKANYLSSKAVASNPMYDGYVLYNEKTLKKPVNLLLLGENTLFFSTNARGDFVMPYAALRGKAGSHLLLSIAKKPVGYKIVMNSPLKQTDDSLAKEYFMLDNFNRDELSAEEKQMVIANKSITLKEVVISAQQNKPKGFYGRINSGGSCNDYVCRFGFLNCGSHPRGDVGTQEAVDGRRYLREGPLGTEQVVYHCEFKGIAPYIQSIKATAYPENPYPLDSAESNFPQSLDRTTLYWQSLIGTDDKGEATLSFYTSQLIGKFTGLIQGISSTGVFNTEINFNVIE
ncbi:MAG TPA: hypothetical protein VIJ75_08855 [Hanamia sp.]